MKLQAKTSISGKFIYQEIAKKKMQLSPLEEPILTLTCYINTVKNVINFILFTCLDKMQNIRKIAAWLMGRLIVQICQHGGVHGTARLVFIALLLNHKAAGYRLSHDFADSVFLLLNCLGV